MRLIDADALYAQIEKMLKRANNAGADEEMYAYLDCQYAIEEAKTIEAVPVVRCKDCIYWGHHLMTKDGKRGDCMHFEVGTKADHFCAFGETMKEDSNGTV